MISMIKIRWKMAHTQNEDNASKELNFKTQTEDGEIRNPTIREEFVKVIKEFKIPVEKVFINSISGEYFSKTNTIVFLNREATALMHMEIWRRFLMARNEVSNQRMKTSRKPGKQFEI